MTPNDTKEDSQERLGDYENRFVDGREDDLGHIVPNDDEKSTSASSGHNPWVLVQPASVKKRLAAIAEGLSRGFENFPKASAPSPYEDLLWDSDGSGIQEVEDNLRVEAALDSQLPHFPRASGTSRSAPSSPPSAVATGASGHTPRVAGLQASKKTWKRMSDTSHFRSRFAKLSKRGLSSKDFPTLIPSGSSVGYQPLENLHTPETPRRKINRIASESIGSPATSQVLPLLASPADPITMRGMRDVDPGPYVVYSVPKPATFGVSSGFMQPAGDDPFCRYADLGDTIEVSLPESVVQGLISWWAGKECSPENYLVCVQYTKNLVAKVRFGSPRQETECVSYAPYVAMTLNVSERTRLLSMAKAKTYSSNRWGAVALMGLLGGFGALPMTAAAAPLVGVTTSLGAGCVLSPVVGVVAAVLAAKALCGTFATNRHLPRAKLATTLSTAKAPTLAEGAVVVVKPTDRDPQRQSAVATATCIPFIGNEPTVFSSNQENVVSALSKRSLSAPPSFDPDFRAMYVGRCYDRIRRWLGKPRSLRVPTEADKWRDHALDYVRNSNSSNSVKAKNRSAILELFDQGITAHSELTDDQVHAWTRREVSIKRETVLKDGDGAPRQIMGATPQFCVLVAPFIAEFTGMVRARLQRPPTAARPVFYAPGAKGRDIAIMQSSLLADLPQLFNIDQAKWDLAQREDCGTKELGLFKSFGLPRAAAQLIAYNLRGVHGFSREGVTFKCPYMRMSGDPHTTVGNTLLAMACGVENVALAIGREPTLTDCFLCSGGDDGSLMTRDSCPDLESIAARAGFPVTCQRLDDPAQLEFLGCRWTRTSLGPVYLPSAGRTIAKLAYSVNADEKTAESVARGSAQSFSASASGNPILSAFVNRVLALTEGVRPTSPGAEPWRMSLAYTGEPTSETWVDLGIQYNWTRELQGIWDAELKGVHRLGEPVSSVIASYLIRHDSGKFSSDPSCRVPEIELTYQHSRVDKQANSGGVKDLTREGIEPNPGWGCPSGSVPHSVASSREWNQTPRIVTCHQACSPSELARVWVDDDLSFDVWHCACAYAADIIRSINFDPEKVRLVTVGGQPFCPAKYQPDLKLEGRLLGGVRSGQKANRPVASKPRAARAKPAKARPAPASGSNARPSQMAPSVSVPAASGGSTGRKGVERAQTARWSSQDFWQNVPGGTYVTGQVILTTPIVPGQMGPWLRTMCQLWEKWRVVDMRMKYVTASASTQPGNVIMFFDPDPTNNWLNYGASADNVKRAFTQTGRTDFSLWQNASATNPNHDWLFTQAQGSDPRFYQGGTFVLMCVTGFTAGADPGALHLEWTVEAKNKAYNQSAISETTLATLNNTYNRADSQYTTLHNVSGLSLACPVLGKSQMGGDYVNAGTSVAEIGVPVAYQNMGFFGGQTFFDPSTPVLALPAGTWMYTFEIEGTNTNFPLSNYISMSPTVGPGVVLRDWEIGPISASRLGQFTGSNVQRGYEGTMYIEVLDDANSTATPLDANNASMQTTAIGGSNNPANSISKMVNKSDDWGFADFVFDLATVGGNIIDVVTSIVDIAGPLLGSIFFTPHASKKAVLYRKYGVARSLDPESRAPSTSEDRLLFAQFLKFKAEVERSAAASQAKASKDEVPCSSGAPSPSWVAVRQEDLRLPSSPTGSTRSVSSTSGVRSIFGR